MKRGVLSNDCIEVAELLLVELDLAVALTLPDPAVAVPVEVPPAFWDPAPVNPAPFPAPLFISAAAPDGIAGRASEVTFQFAD